LGGGVERSQVEREKGIVESKLAKVTDELGMTKSKLFVQTDQKA
jgi:ribosomal protein L29